MGGRVPSASGLASMRRVPAWCRRDRPGPGGNMLPTLVAAAVVLAAQSQSAWAQPLAVGALKAPSSGPLIVAHAQNARPEGMKLRLFESGDQVAAAATSG